MARHAFRFPPDVVTAIKQHVRRAIEGVSPARYRQEPTYTSALVNRLEGVVYEGEHSFVEITGTVIDDRGRNSAERKYGADFAITATVSDGNTTVRKAILVQSKLGRVDELNRQERDRLLEQIRKMRRLIPAPKVMQIPEIDGRRMPSIVSGRRLLSDERYVPMELPDYFSARITTTLDGCTDPMIVGVVKDSSLSQIDVTARMRA